VPPGRDRARRRERGHGRDHGDAPPELATALEELADARGRPPGELAAEAVARFVLEERRALDRVVEARLRQLEAGGAEPVKDRRLTVG
jgi:predicted transcriptional regulator